MISTLKNLFRSRAKEVPDLYDFRILSREQLAEYPNGLKQIHCREIDGIIVKKALSDQEVEQLREFTSALDVTDPKVHAHPKGFVYPVPFSSLGNEIADPTEYHERTSIVRNTFKDSTGVDIESKLMELLGAMAGGRKVGPPELNGIGSCIPYGLRYLKPDCGGLEVHCGNLFHGNHGLFYQHIGDNVDAYDQLSYFFVIQPSESSDLVLLNREWQDGQTKERFDQMYTFTDEFGKEIDCSPYGIERMTIRLEPGDFLTFAGGPIWHLVDEVKGANGRITVGGFMGFTRDDSEIQVWS